MRVVKYLRSVKGTDLAGIADCDISVLTDVFISSFYYPKRPAEQLHGLFQGSLVNRFSKPRVYGAHPQEILINRFSKSGDFFQKPIFPALKQHQTKSATEGPEKLH